MPKVANLESKRLAEEYETPDQIATAPGQAGGPAVTDTEYERPEGLDLNNRTPDAEDGNGIRAEAEGQDAMSEAGFETGVPATRGDDLGLPDAIVGSYPELREAFRAEVIIGTDDRVRINNTVPFPWGAICALKITAGDGRQFIGTGWLVSPRTIITAGHCVFMHDAGGWVRSVQVIPGRNDAASPHGSFSGTAFRSVTGWTQSKNREYDYGCIVLPAQSRPGDRTGYFGFAVRNDAFLTSAALNLSGYPGDKGGNQQWFMAQKARSVSSRVITYNIDTMGGQSGAPVWVLQDGKRYGVGIHTNGSTSGNSATRIETNVFNRIQSWKALGM